MMNNGLVDRLTSNILTGVAAGFVALGSYACGGGGERITDPPVDDSPPTITHANISPLSGMPPLEVTAQIVCEDDIEVRNYTLARDLNPATRTPLPIDTTLTFMRSSDVTMICTDLSGNSSPPYTRHVEIVPREFIGQIAFSMGGKIWVMNQDGSGLETLTNGPQDIEPDFSLDGNYLAFSTNRNGDREIYIRDMDDGSLFRVPTEGIIISGGNLVFPSEPVFSPDGEQLYFSYDNSRPDRGAGIGVINVDGTNFTDVWAALWTSPSPGSPNWSPDGTRIVFHQRRDLGIGFGDEGWEIYATQFDGSIRNITDNSVSVYDVSPDWSFEETAKARIVFVSDPNETDGLDESEIYTMNPDGSDKIQLTDNSAREVDPNWILNGTKILFSRRESPSTPYNIWVMNEDGTNARMIYESPDTDARSPVFRPR